MGFTFLFLRKLLFNFKIHFFDCLKIKKKRPDDLGRFLHTNET